MPLNTLSLGAQTYQILLTEILAGKREAGKRISEESISQEFGISRTPAREALMLLAADGLVERTARKGCRVNHFDRDKQRDIFQCRALLESIALQLGFDQIPTQVLHDLLMAFKKAKSKNDAIASLRADEKLHQLILDSCPNRILAEIISKLIQQCKAFRALRAASVKVKIITEERMEIVRAILCQDKEASGKLLTAHILQGIPKDSFPVGKASAARSTDFCLPQNAKRP